ncbi:protein TUNICAMYCIN INDUCED 1-like [Pyrus communis]|uniref:protein TUNICAMYCIN INDUCED 1-like n=1 Tax=Pyrus communis TaxID=23211 RepID=UPI0035C229A1
MSVVDESKHTQKTMRTGGATVSLLLFLYLQFPLQLILAFNSSSLNDDTRILQEVLKQISAKHKWDLQDVRVSRLDVGRVRFGSAQRYEFRVGFGKIHVGVLFSDDVASWKKFRKPRTHLGSLIQELSSMAVVDTFEVEGPFELRVGGSHELSLSLPMNTTYNGLKRILVGEGITVEVSRAIEVSVFHASDLGLSSNGSGATKKERSEFWPIGHSYCAPLVPIRVLGPATSVAYKTRNHGAHIETNFISKEIVELLPEKCYRSHAYKKRPCPIDSLSLRISMLERIWKGFLGDRIRQNKLSGFVEGKIKASTIVCFKVELELDFWRVGALHDKEGWRTRPAVQRVWFEVLARVELKRVKPLFVRRIRPFIVADSVAWSSLTSNISFTKSGSVLGPPEALTLDVKW